MSKANASTNSQRQDNQPPASYRDKLARAETLDEILRLLRVRREDAQYILVGDGSGNNWEYPCAFAALMIEVATGWRDTFYGGFNCGTNNYAELNAYCNPLDWLADLDAVERSSTGACRIHILSDSEWVVKTGRGIYPKKRHQSTWAKYDTYRRRGFFLHWHWIPGHVGIPANEFADTVAGRVRLLLKNFDVAASFPKFGIERTGLAALYP